MISAPAQARKAMSVAAALAAACALATAGEGELGISSAGWIEYGRIVKSLDTTGETDLEKGMQSAGAQIAARYGSGPLRIHAGLGVRMSHYVSPGSGSGGYAPMMSAPYVAVAHADYAFLDRADVGLSAQAGFFPYDYAPESRNLGLYLLRGPVYPGLLTSGYATKFVRPIANTLGFRINNRLGAFEQDFLLGRLAGLCRRLSFRRPLPHRRGLPAQPLPPGGRENHGSQER
jgi:hypothetical protein